jgi:hypothetical protein
MPTGQFGGTRQVNSSDKKMPVSLLVDSHEPREIVAQAASFENTEVQTMDVGDFIIKSNETPVVVI